MPVDVKPLANKRQTLEQMVEIIRSRSDDLKKYGADKMTFPAWFNYVRKMKYRQDRPGIEIIARPEIVLNGDDVGADCKKKAILIASWLQIHGIPWRLITSSTRADKKIHHVFPQYLAGDNWVNADATYSRFRIGQPKKVTHFEIFETGKL